MTVGMKETKYSRVTRTTCNGFARSLSRSGHHFSVAEAFYQPSSQPANVPMSASTSAVEPIRDEVSIAENVTAFAYRLANRHPPDIGFGQRVGR